MQYRSDKYGNKLSVLGFGCMRFQQKNGHIDLDLAQEQILAACEAGVNYYDTAYVYTGSEAAIGEIFERTGIRDRINIATKLPHYMIKDRDTAEKLFQEELRRLRTDHVDYYLMHMLTDAKTWQRLCDLGIDSWIAEKKAAGQIRQIGFSYHGNTEKFIELLDAYDWEFCQIQYNYLDEHAQAGRKGLQYAASKGIPVVIMEPLRGGKLVTNLPAKAQKLMEESPRGLSPAQWAFRWLWNQPEVSVVLSGMNTLEMVRENCESADVSRIGEFGEEEEALLSRVVSSIQEKMKVPCTGCRYCMPCPRGVDIPGCFAAYNRKSLEGWMNAFREYVMCTLLRKDRSSASLCVECGKCEQHCPQHIEIRKELKNVRKGLEGPIYAIAGKILPLFMKY
ncbi:MAG: aldo/keto reductase [Lachnospiraceae bacterium]|nr:aldo/keto reductase [Lachnospiraceae bacterium]